MAGHAQPTHPACSNPSLCNARYNGALTAFTAGVQAKRESHLPAAVGAFQCALTLLQGCCHANAGALTLSAAFRLAETRLRAHQLLEAVEGATWCLEAAARLAVGHCMNHQILFVRGLALLGMGQREAGLADINSGYAMLPGDRRALGTACLAHVYHVLGTANGAECASMADSQCSSQEAVDDDTMEVCSSMVQGSKLYAL